MIKIQIITQLRSRTWNVTIEHTLREGNRWADHLTKVGAASNSPLVILAEPPSELVNLIQTRGMVSVRV
jgi:hypothetical protein